ncbi:MAG: nitroreductase [Candidatus Thermoplasmatota archaeon]|nr:nitroreductase [Candidatus Thermoplasmatota archaeon]
MSTELIDEIKNRRSIRQYLDEPVKKEVIEEIIQAGRYAPSATNKQPWRFIVITKKDLINSIADAIKSEIHSILKKRFILKYFFPALKSEKNVKVLAATALSKKDLLFFDAPVLVFVVSKKGRFNDESCACCAQNMMLAAHSLGLGSCWIGFAHFLGLNKQWLRKIGVPKGFHIAATLIFGHPKGKHPHGTMRKPNADVINWIEE